MLNRAKDLVGQEVQNMENETLGKVEELVIDLDTGRLLALQIESGGVLGVGSRLVIVPWSLFEHGATGRRLRLDATLETLKGAPEFEMKRWEESNVAGALAESFRYFQVRSPLGNPSNPSGECQSEDRRRVEPTTFSPLPKANRIDPDPEATRIRERDAEMTSQIRREIQAEPSLSQWGRSVKVITVCGRVTLRGLVSCESERELLGNLAGMIAKPTSVDNLLQVRPTPYSATP